MLTLRSSLRWQAPFFLTFIEADRANKPPPNCKAILLQPKLIERSSISPRYASTASKQNGGFQSFNWSFNLTKRKEEARRMNNRYFKGLPFPEDPAFEQLNIAPYLNRSYSRQYSWLGDEPLHELKSGLHVFSGIPFLIVDEHKNDGHACLVMRSAKAHSSGGKPLPASIDIPVNACVRELYVLHALGWATKEETIAFYGFISGRETIDTLAVIAHASESKSVDRQKVSQANIQDWHPSSGRLPLTPNALPCLITRDGDPLEYERYLYTLRWKNPSPEIQLDTFRITAINPDFTHNAGHPRCIIFVLEYFVLNGRDIEIRCKASRILKAAP